MACEICGRSDLFTAVTGESVCAACTIRFGIACPSFGPYRSKQIADARAFLIISGERPAPTLPEPPPTA